MLSYSQVMEISIKSKWLRSYKAYISQFIQLDPEDWTALIKAHHPVSVPKGELFSKPGMDTPQLGFIVQGILRTFFLSETGEEYTTDFCSENEISSCYDILAPDLSKDYFSRAVEDVILLKMDFKRYQALSQTSPKLEVLKNKLINQYYVQKITREKELLSMDATQKYQEFITHYSHIAHRLRQYEIASYIGVTPVQLSRIKKDLSS